MNSKINFTLPTAILIHGWFDSAQRTWVKTTVSEYIKYVNANICAVDWERLALTEYTIAAENTKTVAISIADFINRLQENGVKLNQLTLIGHSFGAQIAGHVGRIFNGQISRIIGLDPAGWQFTKPFIVHPNYRLDKSDAKFVQCIHTNGNFIGLGSFLNCGHQDFYPNGGLSPQPGCTSPNLESSRTLCKCILIMISIFWLFYIIFFFSNANV